MTTPCPDCGGTEFYTASGNCKACVRASPARKSRAMERQQRRVDEALAQYGTVAETPAEFGKITLLRVEVIPRRCLSRIEAARYVGISVTMFDELVAERVMPKPFNLRSRKLWDIRQLDAAIDGLVEGSAGKSKWDFVA